MINPPCYISVQYFHLEKSAAGILLWAAVSYKVIAAITGKSIFRPAVQAGKLSPSQITVIHILL